jgi:decaprenylphospho-beta-D-erythro-pentofuranosid-2-ulose 2-reductase
VTVKVLIVGATRGMGRAVARRLAARGDELFIAGRSASELARSAADLEQRGAKGRVGFAPLELLETGTFAGALDAAEGALGGLDTVVITAGLFGTQEQLEADTELLSDVLTADFTGTILLCEAVRKRFVARGQGTLVVFSSVAGDRGRKTNGLYGATKAGLSHYLEALDHKWRSSGLVTINVKPGFVITDMTAGLKPPPFAGQPEDVAARVVTAIDRGWPVVYAPAIWGWVMLVIKNLPRFVMRRIGF